METTTTMKKPQGFACLSPEQRGEIAQKGGRAAHASGRAHKWNSAEASVAGRKGAIARRLKLSLTSND